MVRRKLVGVGCVLAAALAGSQSAYAQNVQVCTPTEIVALEDVGDPLRSDADQNDLLVRYKACSMVDSQGYLVDQTINLAPMAAGGVLPLELQVLQPDTVLAELTTSGGTVTVAPDAQGHVSVGAKAELFPGATGITNTLEGRVDHAGEARTLHLDIATGTVFVGGETPEPAWSILRSDDGTRIDGASVLSDNDQPLLGLFPGGFEPVLERTGLCTAYADACAHFTEVVGGCLDRSDCLYGDWATRPTATEVNDEIDYALEVAALPADPSCADGIRNRDEPEIDCGGTFCVACGGTPAATMHEISGQSGTTDYTHGWSFTPHVAMQVSHLGIWDSDTKCLDGLCASHDVGLWTTTGTLLGSVNVPSGAAAPARGEFRYVPLGSAISLQAGQTYVLGAYYASNFNDGGDSFWKGETGPTFSADLTAHEGRASAGNGFPSGTKSTYSLGPNFLYTVP